MITLRKAEDRGHFDHGWLNTFHTFSFSDYRDPKHVHYSVLRVINDDTVVAGEGFDTHGHEDMEIVTYVLQGQLAHKDSMGNGSMIKPGDVQRMSAGTGITHSEFNGSKTESVHFLQLWIFPEKKGLEPGYEQKAFDRAEKLNRLRLVASRDGREGSVTIHQDARIFAGVLEAGKVVEYAPASGRKTWVHVARGGVSLEAGGARHALRAGDGVAVEGERTLSLTGGSVNGSGAAECEVLVFDLP
jgi:redox-sensitive bicupin YhaK (pirin superfamily)